MKRILLFKSLKVCYDATAYYIDAIKKELEQRDFDVVIFELFQETLLGKKKELIDLSKEHFDLLLAINSELSTVKIQDEYIINLFQVPFYNFIVDHPLYHHTFLQPILSNYHVICIDDYHADFVRKYYPYIRSVSTLFLTGFTSPEQIAYNKRKNDLCFIGTYTKPSNIIKTVEKYDNNIQNLFHNLVDIMLLDTSLTQEAALEKYLKTLGKEISDKFFLEVLSGMYIADVYLRALEREQALETLADSGEHLLVCGHGWEKSAIYQLSNCDFIGPVEFRKCHAILADTRIAINVMPRFQQGVHDRVFSAMLNGCVCLTNTSEYLAGNFNQEEDILYYNAKRLDAVPNLIHRLLEQKDELEMIAENARIKAEQFHTWSARVDQLCKIWNMDSMAI